MPSSVSNTCPPLSFAILSIIGNLLRILLLLFSKVDLGSCLLFFSNGTVEHMLPFVSLVVSGIQLDKLKILSTFIEFGVSSCGKCNTRDAYYGKRLI